MFLYVLPISKIGSFYIGKSKTFIKNFQDIPRTYHSKTLIVNKNFQDIYIFLKFLSKTLLSCPTLISEIEEYSFFSPQTEPQPLQPEDALSNKFGGFL